MAFKRVEEIRAWQEAYAFKLAIYDLVRDTPIANDARLRDQMRTAAASAVSQIEEGYARFYPKDFGRLVVGSKASIAEVRGHLRDAVDRGYISDETRGEHDLLAQDALREIVGLVDYLQSPEAEANARRIKIKRAERRARRERNREPRTRNSEPGTPNLGTSNPEHRTGNIEPGTPNREPEPRTRNREPEPGTRTRNPEPGTRNGEGY
jgi:four helix bundle protein